MRRAITLAVAAGLCALIVAAAIDALRESEPDADPPETTTGPPETEPSTEQRESAERLRRHGLTGVLYLSPQGCESAGPAPLRAVRLPGLDPVDAPEFHACTFSLSPDGEAVADASSVWQPQGLILAGSGSGTIELSSREPVWGVSLGGSAPAFKPDGTLTQVRDRKVIEWTPECGEGDETVTFLGGDPPGPRCPHTVLTRAELAKALFGEASVEGVEALSWLTNSRVLAVLRTDAGDQIAGYTNGRARWRANSPFSDVSGGLEVSPDGAYAAVQAGRQVEVYDRFPGHVWASGFDEVLAFDWSPDGRWLAVATRNRVHLVRASDWTAPVVLPFETQDLAWR